jgi:hypothetical protein
MIDPFADLNNFYDSWSRIDKLEFDKQFYAKSNMENFIEHFRFGLDLEKTIGK